MSGTAAATVRLHLCSNTEGTASNHPVDSQQQLKNQRKELKREPVHQLRLTGRDNCRLSAQESFQSCP